MSEIFSCDFGVSLCEMPKNRKIPPILPKGNIIRTEAPQKEMQKLGIFQNFTKES